MKLKEQVKARLLASLDESNLTPSSTKVKIIKNGNKHELTIRQPNRKVTGYHKSFDSREDAEKFIHQKWGADALVEDFDIAPLDEALGDNTKNKVWAMTSTQLKKKMLADYKKKHGFDAPEAEELKTVVKNGKRVYEEIDELDDSIEELKEAKIKGKIITTHLASGKPNPAHPRYNEIKSSKTISKTVHEGRMAELSADIGDHMDKHIGEYKRAGGAEALMHHAGKAAPKIAKLHGIEHKHAEKFISDYIDSKLNEDALDEASDPAVHLRRARSAANRDEQEMYVKHMINYHKGMIKSFPDKAAEHTDKIAQLKKNIGEELLDGSVAETLEESIMKKLKRAINGWGADDNPMDLVKRNRAYNDKQLANLANADTSKLVSHSPAGLQQRVVKQEIERRNKSK